DRTEQGSSLAFDACGNLLVGGGVHAATLGGAATSAGDGAFEAFLLLLDGGTGKDLAGVRSNEGNTAYQLSVALSVAISPVDQRWWAFGTFFDALAPGGVEHDELKSLISADLVTFLVSFTP